MDTPFRATYELQNKLDQILEIVERILKRENESTERYINSRIDDLRKRFPVAD